MSKLDELIGDARDETEITSVEKKTSKEVFGDKAKSERDVLLIKTAAHPENASGEVISMPQGLEYDGEKYTVTDKTALARSLRNKQSKMRNFVKKYNDFPTVGMKVWVNVDEKGFTALEFD